MEKIKKTKIIIGLIYLVILSIFLYFLFHNFNFEDISSIKVIQSNQDQLNILKENNLILLISIFFLLTVLWVLLLGFGSPIALIGGFIFGKWIGTIIVTTALSIGALCLYIFAKYFLYDFLNNPKIRESIPTNSKIVWGSKFLSLSLADNYPAQNFKEIYLIASPPAISGGMIENPKALISDLGNDNAGQWVVNLDMTTEGKKKWSRFTAKNINRRVAIVLDNEVFMAPTIRDKITAGSTQISGFNDMEEAKNIASILKAGELPAPINAIQTNFVGPSLGKDSIKAGTSAMIIGVTLVFFFMIFYYRVSGLIACFALLLNLFIVLAVLVTMNAVLTLPGIAGLLLTVGMTVDANVIIFERIKEELLSGTKVNQALETAYRKAFLTILDANITTLITAFVLSFIGSGPIKGFATTLSVGIICSMFTAVFVTKTIFLFNFNNKNKISI